MASTRNLFLLALLLVVPAKAGTPSDAVVVTALRKPVQKSYEKMVSGMELFEKRRQLAPEATLRWKLLPRKADTKMEGIRLEIAADSFGVPIEVGPDRTFTLARNEAGLKEEARVMPDRKEGSMTWRADVRTPGLPPHVRRLGDLRLECEVGMQAGTISNYPPAFFGFFDIRREGPRYCHRAEPRYLFFAERPVWNVTLEHGDRREAISIDRLYISATRNPDWRKSLQHCDCEVLVDRAYFVPLGDASWPDDTLVVLEYMS
jgi:hypothetical protein